MGEEKGFFYPSEIERRIRRRDKEEKFNISTKPFGYESKDDNTIKDKLEMIDYYKNPESAENIDDIILCAGLAKKVEKTKKIIYKHFPNVNIREVNTEQQFYDEVERQKPLFVVGDGFVRDDKDNSLYYFDDHVVKLCENNDVEYICSRLAGIWQNVLLNHKLKKAKEKIGEK